MFKLMYLATIALSGCLSVTSELSATDISTESSVKAAMTKPQNENNTASLVILNATKTTSYSNLKLRVINIEDSRCPTGTACIWEGQMIVILEVSNEFQDKREITLAHKRKPKTAAAFGFDFRLQEIKPHPKNGQKIQLSDQVITLQIEAIKQNIH